MKAESRLAGLRARLEGEGVDAILVIDPVNVAYVTGFEQVFDDEAAHVAFITQDAATLITDSRYAEAARAAGKGTTWQISLAAASLSDEVRRMVERAKVGAVALEDSLPVSRYQSFEAALEDRATSASGWVEALRAVKEDDEVARIDAAQQLTDAAFAYIVERLMPGVTESMIALDLEFFMRSNGSEGVAFAPIVASGPNSALPHAKVSSRALVRGDFVKLDFGARIDGYCADMTRTVVLGSASEKQRAYYEAVLAANIAGIAAVAEGTEAREVDGAARSVIEQAGFGELFTHGLGHGVGMQVHESPRVGPRSEDVLRRGNVVTVEPGVYEPGFGGVRIEDLVVVHRDGARVLTRTPKDLLEL